MDEAINLFLILIISLVGLPVLSFLVVKFAMAAYFGEKRKQKDKTKQTEENTCHEVKK